MTDEFIFNMVKSQPKLVHLNLRHLHDKSIKIMCFNSLRDGVL